MSSPIHLDEDIDPATMYAPPWARERISSSALPQAMVVPIRGSSKLEFSGDRAMLELQRQLVLEPDLIPEPAPERQSIAGPIIFRLGGAVGIAAFIAWSMVSYSEMKKAAASVSVDSVASIGSSEGLDRVDGGAAQTLAAAQLEEIIAPAPLTTGPAASGRLSAPQFIATTTSTSSSPLATTTDVGAAASMPIAPPQSIGSPQGYQAPNEPPVSQLEADELETLLKRGKDLLADGDLASARLLLRRAAEGGNAEAALALGTTYDPLVIQRLGVLGAPPDLEQARQWYQRAAELGSNSASQRLARLAAAP